MTMMIQWYNFKQLKIFIKIFTVNDLNFDNLLRLKL